MAYSTLRASRRIHLSLSLSPSLVRLPAPFELDKRHRPSFVRRFYGQNRPHRTVVRPGHRGAVEIMRSVSTPYGSRKPPRPRISSWRRLRRRPNTASCDKNGCRQGGAGGRASLTHGIVKDVLVVLVGEVFGKAQNGFRKSRYISYISIAVGFGS